MDRTRRNTLLLGLVLAALVLGLVLLGFLHPRPHPGDVHTRIVFEMVAALDGLLLRVGREPGSAPGAGLHLPWPLLVGLGAGLGLFVLRRRQARQQHLRSSNS